MCIRDRSSDRGRKSRSHSREATPHVNSRRVANRDSDTGRDSSVERSPSEKREKKKKKEKRRSKSRRVRSTSRGLQQLPSNVDVASSGSSNINSSIFLEHEPTLVMPKSTSGSRRVRRTRAQDKLEHGEWLCRDLGRRLRDMFEEQEGDLSLIHI